MDKFKATAFGIAPGGAFVFGMLAGGAEGFWHWVYVLLGLACVGWLSFTMLAFMALRASNREKSDKV